MSSLNVCEIVGMIPRSFHPGRLEREREPASLPALARRPAPPAPLWIPILREPLGRWPVKMNRREWLSVGCLAGLSWAVGDHRSLAAVPSGAGAPGFGQARSVIVIFASGGQSQIDMWDPKPEAPLEVRGEFRPLRTAVPGVTLCEHMPHIARLVDRFTIIRSMSHEDLDHGSAAYLTLTGRYHVLRSANPPPSRNDFPTLGAALRRARPQQRVLADAVHLNGPALVPKEPAPGQDGGFLGRAYEPLLVGDVRQSSVATRGLTPRAEVPAIRMQARLALKESLDQQLRLWESSHSALDVNRQYREAFELLSSPSARQAFDLDAEPAGLRDRYGRHRSGQACLLARRLVEAGVPLINVIWNHSNRGQDDDPSDTDVYGWDTHNDIFVALREHLLPRFDRTFSTLLTDLEQRGLLDQTLVICIGEFGRAPQVALEPRFAGVSPGRKHWASVYSIVMAGAGIGRGTVVGASDRLGGEPANQRYGPWDVAATVYHALGIHPHQTFLDAVGRPFPLSEGHPIAAAYA